MTGVPLVSVCYLIGPIEDDLLSLIHWCYGIAILDLLLRLNFHLGGLTSALRSHILVI